jgi:hypothetical protein
LVHLELAVTGTRKCLFVLDKNNGLGDRDVVVVGNTDVGKFIDYVQKEGSRAGQDQWQKPALDQGLKRRVEEKAGDFKRVKREDP